MGEAARSNSRRSLPPSHSLLASSLSLSPLPSPIYPAAVALRCHSPHSYTRRSTHPRRIVREECSRSLRCCRCCSLLASAASVSPCRFDCDQRWGSCPLYYPRPIPCHLRSFDADLLVCLLDGCLRARNRAVRLDHCSPSLFSLVVRPSCCACQFPCVARCLRLLRAVLSPLLLAAVPSPCSRPWRCRGRRTRRRRTTTLLHPPPPLPRLLSPRPPSCRSRSSAPAARTNRHSARTSTATSMHCDRCTVIGRMPPAQRAKRRQKHTRTTWSKQLAHSNE